MAKARRPAGDEDERAAQLAASLVREYRGRGLSDEDLMAAAMRGVVRALGALDAGYDFDTWCTWSVRQALSAALDQRQIAQRPSPSSAARLFPSDFGSDLCDRMKAVTHAKAWARHDKRLKTLLDPPPARARDVSRQALAFFDLFVEHQEAIIEPWCLRRLEHEVEAINKVLGDDEQLETSQFSLRRVSLPTDEHRWELTLMNGNGLPAFMSFLGWQLQAVQVGD